MRRELRVIGGEARSLHLRVPTGTKVRPTTDAMRETLFSSLGADVRRARFADLYAGSGAVGIEALSRGAQLAVFVERDSRCTEVIQQNLENTKLAERAVVLRRSLPAAWAEVAQAHGPFDIVFVDPPYDTSELPALARQLVCQQQGVAAEAIVVLQHERSEPVLRDPLPDKTKAFGHSRLDIYYLEATARGEERKTDGR